MRKRRKLMLEARKQVKALSRKMLGALSSDGKNLVKDLREKVHRVTSESDLEAVIYLRNKNTKQTKIYFLHSYMIFY